MGTRPRHGLSLCAGGGGLDMGLQLAEPQFETRCYVEWEDYPQRAIIAAQRAGYFAPAPIWDDVTTFDGRPWRGHIDTILAGYPCQPFSQAGQRKGEDDDRHLWPDVARVIGEVDPDWVFLENVAGHLSLGADTVLGDLGGMDFTPAVGLYTSKEAGGSHDRLRMFIVAHRVRSGTGARAQPSAPLGSIGAGRRLGPQLGNQSNGMADAHGRNTRAEREQRSREQRFHQNRGDDGRALVDDATGSRRIRTGVWPASDNQSRERLSGAGREPVVDPTGERFDGSGSNQSGRQPDDSEPSSAMGDASQSRPQGREQHRAHPDGYRPGAYGPASEPGRPWISPPGPKDANAWQAVLAQTMEYAPAIGPFDIWHFADHAAQMAQAGQLDEAQAESAVRRMVDALAERPRALRLLGNGVDPLAAANAWRNLALAHGLIPLDLEAGRTDEPVLIGDDQ